MNEQYLLILSPYQADASSEKERARAELLGHLGLTHWSIRTPIPFHLRHQTIYARTSCIPSRVYGWCRSQCDIYYPSGIFGPLMVAFYP